MPLPLALPAALTLAVLLTTTGAARAADKPARQGGFGQAKAGGPLLTRAQLRLCLAQQDRIQAESSESGQQRTQLDAEQTALKARGAELKEQLAALDRSSQAAVDAYNAQAAERDAAIDAFEGRAAAYNQRVEALKGEQAAFAKACDNRRYDEKDELEIRSGK